MTKILLAEDDLFLRDIYLEILNETGYNITAASDGEQAFEELKKGGWDLVLLDVVMPKMSGIDVLKSIDKDKIRGLARHILFMTNNDEKKLFVEVKDMVDGYLLKSSFNPEELVTKIKEYL